MKTALVTDGKYRSSIAAVRALHRAGYRVVVTQTRADVKSAPAVSVSKSCDDFRWIDGACADADYAEKLLSVLKEYEHPVLFCVGAVTLNTVAARREEFAALANFLIAPKETLDALNDKESVHQRALELGIPVPREYDGTPESYPVVVKPHCGEKFGRQGRRPLRRGEQRGGIRRHHGKDASATTRAPSCSRRSRARARA